MQPTFERATDSLAITPSMPGKLLPSFVAALRADCATWRVPTGVGYALLIYPFVVALVVALALANRSLYDLLVNEDGILEWAEVVGYAGASLLGLLLAWRLSRQGRRVDALLFLLFGLAIFFIAGEEISWGQRLFDVETPAELSEINAQQETTVHNISALRVAFHLGFLLVGCYGSVVATVLRLRLWPRYGELLRLYVPPLFLATSFLLLFAYRSLRFTFDMLDSSAVGRYGEVTELCLACALLTFTFLLWRDSLPASQNAATGIGSTAMGLTSEPEPARS